MGSFTNLSYHIIFGTKHRRPLIRREIRDDLYDYAGGIIRGLKGNVVEIGGVEDHVHILTQLPPTITVSDTVRDLKSSVSKWMNERPNANGRFEWQKGYSAFTVSLSQWDAVIAYLRRQDEHHKLISFKEEYIEFLIRHQIRFEEKYLFDDEFV